MLTSTDQGTPIITFFYRKKYRGNYSIEGVFDQISTELRSQFCVRNFVVSSQSKGLIKRILIVLECFRNQTQINHITGDIHFAAFLLRKKKTILTIHDIGLLAGNRNFIVRQLFTLFWLKIPISRCQFVTTVSEFTKESLLKHVKVDPGKIFVIHNPINLKFVPMPKEFNKERPELLLIGTKSNKNLIRAIKAVKNIKCSLSIVGALSQEQISELNANRIAYRNYIDLSEGDVYVRYLEADVVLFVSTFEGFGLPIIEANAVGRAVITSNLAPMTEIGHDAAAYVDPFDIGDIEQGLKRVIGDDLYREQLISSGYVNVKRFLPKTIALKYAALYNQILEQR